MPTINLTDPQNDTTADASLIAANNAAIEAVLNGGIDEANVSSIPASKITDLPTIPTGSVLDYAGSSAPTGYLLCDGSAVSRTTYSALFAIVSTTYGAGDGSTTFNVPDHRGRVAVGKGTHVDVDTLGENDGLAVGSRRVKHTHTTVPDRQGVGNPGSEVTGATATTAEGPAYIVLNKIIKT